MTSLSCAQILAGRAPQGGLVTVKGWVRTRRDSKAGLSFVHVSDGSCFHPVQVVAPNTLPNYATEVQQLTAGCAVEATGTIVPSPAKGQPFEMQATAVQGGRLGRGPGHLPDPAQAAHAGVPARGRAPAPAHQRDRRRHARAPHARAGDPPLLPRATASSGSTRRSSPPPTPRAPAQLFRVSTLDLANLPRTPRGQGRLRAGLLRHGGVPHRVRPAQRRGLLPGAVEGLHLRARRSAPRTPTPAATSPSSG